MAIPALGGEQVRVHPHGEDAVVLTVDDPRFGRIATVRLSALSAGELAVALAGTLLDRGAGPARAADEPSSA